MNCVTLFLSKHTNKLQLLIEDETIVIQKLDSLQCHLYLSSACVNTDLNPCYHASPNIKGTNTATLNRFW
jgi:hypothetical protein